MNHKFYYCVSGDEILQRLIVSLIACVSDPKAARDIVFGPDGILQYVTPKKAYVDMSTVDPQTAQGKNTSSLIELFVTLI